MKRTRLGLFSHVLPALDALKTRDEADEYGGAKEQFELAKDAVIFDCRSIPGTFVDDTGEAALHEAEETKGVFRLPFPTCYFEFDSELAVLAVEVDQYACSDLDSVVESSPEDSPAAAGGRLEGTIIEFYTYSGWGFIDRSEVAMFPDMLCDGSFGQFRNWLRLDGEDFDPELIVKSNIAHAGSEIVIEDGAKVLAGVLTLISEKLLATEVLPDEMPALNRARAKKGKTPLSAETRILTINTGAVRRALALNVGERGTHATPRLHWRRGHRRILHRGSEFESQTWVRKCLVGDPSLGFVQKNYAVTWAPPMIEPSAQ